MKLRRLTGIMAFLAVCGISYSQDSFSLNDILERAKTSNPDVKIQRINTEEKEKKKIEL